MSEWNEIELRRLNKLISDLQLSIFLGGGAHAATTSILVKQLAEAQGCSAAVELEQVADKDKQEREERQELAIAVAIAEREIALSRAERAEFASFLEHRYFTREMFGRLDEFYTHSWDRLSENGKAEMSQRVWAGVRHGEYQFIELPETVKEKEASRVHQLIERGAAYDSRLEQIPQNDRDDFERAWNGKERNQSYEVLSRPSFSKALSSPRNEESLGTDALEAVKNKSGVLSSFSEPSTPPTAPLPELKGQSSGKGVR